MVQTITVETRDKDAVVDITDEVAHYLRGQEQAHGVCLVFAAHTTCALTAADLDPGTDRDLLEALRKLLPPMRYRHPHDPAHTPDHILASLIGPSVTLPFQGKRLLLGTWQRIVLVEFDGPRQRTVHLAVM